MSQNQVASAASADGQPTEEQSQTMQYLTEQWERLPGLPHPSQNISSQERWISAGAGGLLALLGLMRGKTTGWLAVAAGAALLHRGLSGHCYGYEALGMDTSEGAHKATTAVPAQEGVRVEKAITINRSRADLFGFWREVENLPQVMRHLKRVDAIDSQRSRWIAHGPLGKEVQWEAEVFNERPGEMIAWRSLPGGDIETAGSVHFKAMGRDRGTEVSVSMKYNPPAGKAGAGIAYLLGSGLEQKINDDLRNFKRMMEAGEIPTTAGQPRGET